MKFKITFLLLALTFATYGQEEEGEEGRLDAKIDQITYDWDLEADKLSSYTGFQVLCANEEYRQKIFALLNDIHHYDTVLYNVLLKLSKKSDDKEIEKTLKDIKKFEADYNTKTFIHFMNEECKAMVDIEKNADETKNEVGSNSYSGQIYLLETELVKYVNHVTDRVDKIRQHVHHLSKNYKN